MNHRFVLYADDIHYKSTDMKSTLPFLLMLSFALFSCDKKEEKVVSLCTDPCLKDSVKFAGDHALKPYVYILPDNCFADTVVWSHKLVEKNKKIILSEYTNRDVIISPQTITAHFKDTGYVWLLFNDCTTSRGYALQLPFDTVRPIKKYLSALNRIDQRYNVAEGLIAYADYSFVYVEDMNTGKTAQMLLSEKELSIDFNAIHNTFDSVHITRNRMYVKLNGKDPVEKTISLE